MNKLRELGTWLHNRRQNHAKDPRDLHAKSYSQNSEDGNFQQLKVVLSAFDFWSQSVKNPC